MLGVWFRPVAKNPEDGDFGLGLIVPLTGAMGPGAAREGLHDGQVHKVWTPRRELAWRRGGRLGGRRLGWRRPRSVGVDGTLLAIPNSGDDTVTVYRANGQDGNSQGQNNNN